MSAEKSEQAPVLSVGRFVQNIGEREMSGLQERLIEEAIAIGERPEEVSHNMFHSGSLYTQIIARGEFSRIQRMLGPDRQLNAEQVDELKDVIEEVLSARPEQLEVPTMPVLLQHQGQYPRFSLRIAYGRDVLEDRRLAQMAIFEFAGLQRGVGDWFWRAKRSVPVRLAASYSEPQFELLKALKPIIEQEQPLPEDTVFGKVKVKS